MLFFEILLEQLWEFILSVFVAISFTKIFKNGNHYKLSVDTCDELYLFFKGCNDWL